VLSLLLTLALAFYFAGGRHKGLLVDRLCLLSTHDQRSTVVLQPHPGDDQGVHHFWDNGKCKVLSVDTVKVSESVTLRRVYLVKSLGYNLLSVSQLLDEGFEVHFKMGCSRVFGFSRQSCVHDRPRGSDFQSRFFLVCWLFSLFGCWCFGEALEMA
jgi:hypothetical protein